MEEKREVAYAHKKVLQGPLKEDADEFFYTSIYNGLSTDIYFHDFEFVFEMTNIKTNYMMKNTAGRSGRCGRVAVGRPPRYFHFACWQELVRQNDFILDK